MGQLCKICHGTFFSACIRCEESFCMEHAPLASKRCPDCEINFRDEDKRSPLLLMAAMLGFLYSWISMSEEVPMGGGSFLGIAVEILCFLGAIGTAALVLAIPVFLLRERFLSERPVSSSPAPTLPKAFVVKEEPESWR